jgi:hypothetical protein
VTSETPKEKRQSSGQNAGEKESCSRIVAAARAYHEKINPNKMLQKAKQDCDAGDGRACLAIPMVWPYAAYLEVFMAPLLIPIYAADPDIQSKGCPDRSSTPEASATAADSQPLSSGQGVNSSHVSTGDVTQFHTPDRTVGYNLWCETGAHYQNWSDCYKSLYAHADSLCGAKNYNVLSDTTSTVNLSGGTAYRINLVFQCKA